MRAVLTVAAWCAVVFSAAVGIVLLNRTATLRPIVDATPEWRRQSDTRVATLERRLDEAKEERGALARQIVEVFARTDRVEKMLAALGEAKHGR